MAVELTSEQVVAVSAKRTYPKSTWTTLVDDFVKSGKPGIGKIESDFPGIKPAHVAHMIRQELKARPNVKASVAIDKSYGVVLKKG